MATGTIILTPPAAATPDGSAGNAGPGITRHQGTEASPKKHFWTYDFDATADEFIWFVIRMPSDYASGPVAKLQWFAGATTGTCRWSVSLGAITAGDADTPLEHANATVNTAAGTPNATEANRLVETSITLTNADSVAAGDLVHVCVSRDADGTSGTDDMAGDANFVLLALEYTTS